MTTVDMVAVLHPGAMGSALGSQVRAAGRIGLWCPRGRSAASAARADDAGLVAVDDLTDLLARSGIVLSVCPPGPAADELADLVLGHGYRGLYVDANAISPGRMAGIAARLSSGGVRVVDGAVIGPPPGPDRPASLYLAGDDRDVARVAELFEGTACGARPLRGAVGTASALKAAFAGYNKATQALAGVSHALAVHYGVQDALLDEAAMRTPDSPLARPERLSDGAAKAWRWVPEFAEIADTLTGAGLPADLARAVGTVLEHWAELKDDSAAGLSKILSLL